MTCIYLPTVVETQQDKRRRVSRENLEAKLGAYQKIPDTPIKKEYREVLLFDLFDSYMNCLAAGITKEELRQIGRRYDFDFTGGLGKAA